MAISQPVYAQINEFKITASDGVAGDRFGISVSSSGDYAVVGTITSSAYVFKRIGTSWAEEAILLASDGAGGFGTSVSISGDYTVVGASRDNDNGNYSGSAYVFKRSGTSWTEEAKLLASDGAESDNFGWSVSISGDYVVVGAKGDEDNGDRSGSAYVFKRSGTSWVEETKLLASDGAALDNFGSSVSISGDYAFVGATWDGSVYVFKRSGTSWVEETKLLASDGAGPSKKFGNSVSISGEYAVVGAFTDDDNGNRSGSAYVFKRTGTSWAEEAKLLASDGAADDQFGYSVSTSGFYAVVGANWDNDNGLNAGSAYLFKRSGTSWTEEAKLLASDGGVLDENFGHSVSISGGYAIVGAMRDDDNGSQSGSAYVYSGFAPIGVLSVSPASLDFSNVLVGETTTELVTVSNTGIGDLIVSSIAITGIDSLNFSVDTTSFTLLPGDSTVLDVSFTPDDTGSFNASLDIDSDGGSVNVVLSGNDIIDPDPSIVLITDVPHDQGGSVTLKWNASSLDVNINSLPYYSIWRALPDGTELQGTFKSIADMTADFAGQTYRIESFRGNDLAWEWIANQPAHRFAAYSYTAPTLFDSSLATFGKHYFMVSAHTNDPDLFYDSIIDSGYSVDNLAPAVPTGLLASVTETNTVELSWDEPVDEDFNYFKIYRSLTSDFDPTGLEPFAETIDTTFTDINIVIGETYYYILSAVDFNGNESAFSDDVSAEILSLDETMGIPEVFALRQNYPNPFNPITTLRYDLPENSFVKITIYDLLGREVKTLFNRTQDAGYKSVVWNATNDHGKPVSAGVYLIQIHAGEFVQTKKMILLR